MTTLRRAVITDPVARRKVMDQVFFELGRIYRAAREHGVDVALLILPVREQLFKPELQGFHGDLVEHARQQGVGCLDLTTEIERYIARDVERILRDQGGHTTPNRGVLKALYGFQANLYYMDGLHLTAHGHRLVAWRLGGYLDEHYNLGFGDEFVRAAQDELARAQSPSFSVMVPPDYSSVISVCTALEILGKYEQAAGVYEAVLGATDHPGMRSLLHYLLGHMRLNMGRREEAVEQMRRSVGSFASDWPGARPGRYTRFGWDLVNLGLAEEAARVFAKAVEADSNDSEARKGLERVGRMVAPLRE